MTLKESPTVQAQREAARANGTFEVPDWFQIDCDLDARLIAVTGNHSEVALIDLDTMAVFQVRLSFAIIYQLKVFVRNFRKVIL